MAFLAADQAEDGGAHEEVLRVPEAGGGGEQAAGVREPALRLRQGGLALQHLEPGDRPANLERARGERVDLRGDAGEVAPLERHVDRPQAGGELEVRVADLAAEAQHPFRQPFPLG